MAFSPLHSLFSSSFFQTGRSASKLCSAPIARRRSLDRPAYCLIAGAIPGRSRFIMADKVGRNPHPDFKQVERSRPEWDSSAEFRYTKTVEPDWAFGDGANRLQDDSGKKHIAIDPYAPNRPRGFNYKLLISGINPRPIAFLSTLGADGTSTNLAPFSFFNLMSDDPPLFTIGFSSPGDRPSKDSLRNLRETRECVINIISEHFIEAANAASVNAPYGVSEWEVSGLTPAGDCETVRCARVKEAVFSIEAKLDYIREYDSRVVEGKKGGTIAIIEATRFWVREDALNEDQNLIDISVLKPVSRLGGISYGRTTQGIELPRTDFEKDFGGQEGLKNVNEKNKKL